MKNTQDCLLASISMCTHGRVYLHTGTRAYTHIHTHLHAHTLAHALMHHEYFKKKDYSKRKKIDHDYFSRII